NNLSLSCCRNNSIACLRAKAQEHQARLLNNGGLFLQVRSFAQAQAQAQAQVQAQAQAQAQAQVHAQCDVLKEERNNNNNNNGTQQLLAASNPVKMELT
ncbi:hypothetical protein KR093_006720, partial [Drosophila rubida]